MGKLFSASSQAYGSRDLGRVWISFFIWLCQPGVYPEDSRQPVGGVCVVSLQLFRALRWKAEQLR